MKTSVKNLLPILLAVIAVAAFYNFVIAPKRAEIATLDTQITEQEAALQQAEMQAATYAKAKDNYRANYTKLAALGKAVPADDDVRSLLVQIDETAKASGVDFRSINITAASSATPGSATGTTTGSETAPPPGTVSVGSAGFSAMPFNFSFEGDYFRLSDFLHQLEDFVSVQNDKVGVTGRLLLLGNITVTPKGGEKDPDRLGAQIGAAAYLVPPTQGVAGATPPATAATPGTTPAATTPPTDPATSASTSTATVTGVQ